MKKTILMNCLLLMTFGLFAQQNFNVAKSAKGTDELTMMKNLDFTTWNTDIFTGLGEQPEGWLIISCKPSQQKTTDAQNGQYAAYLETGIVNLPLFGVFNQLLPGMLVGSDAITAAPSSMTFWAKGEILGNDEAGVEVIFMKNGKEAGGGYLGLKNADLGNIYKQFTINLSYTGSGQPDTLELSVGSGGGYGSSGVATGSKFYFDNVAFIYGPAATVSPEVWDAGTVAVGSNSVKNFTLKNVGKGTLTVSNTASLAAPWATNFNSASVSLAEGETYPFTITFTPTAEGNFNTSFVITSNGGTKTVTLTGKGFLGDPELLSITPEFGAADVKLNAEIVAAFNMNIASSSLNEITVVPNPGGVIPKIIGNKLLITHNNLAPYTPYIVAVPSDVIDRYEVPITWSFATGDKLGVTEIDKNEVKIYPNPSTGDVNVMVTENSTVKVFELTGKLIKTYEHVTEGVVLNFTLPSGVYFVQVETDNSVRINKMVVK